MVWVGALVRLYVPLAVPYLIVAPLVGVVTVILQVSALPSYTLLLLDALTVIALLPIVHV